MYTRTRNEVFVIVNDRNIIPPRIWAYISQYITHFANILAAQRQSYTIYRVLSRIIIYTHYFLSISPRVHIHSHPAKRKESVIVQSMQLRLIEFNVILACQWAKNDAERNGKPTQTEILNTGTGTKPFLSWLQCSVIFTIVVRDDRNDDALSQSIKNYVQPLNYIRYCWNTLRDGPHSRWCLDYRCITSALRVRMCAVASVAYVLESAIRFHRYMFSNFFPYLSIFFDSVLLTKPFNVL